MMTEEDIKNLIKEATVKITVTLSTEVVNGTGVLISQNNKLYVVTVYHCIYGKEDTSQEIINQNIELKFHSTVSVNKLNPINIEPISSNIVILELDNDSITKTIQYEYLDRVYYEKKYHIRGFPSGLSGQAHYFTATCNDNDIDTIGFSIELNNLTDDTSGENTIDYISGISGSGIFFSEHGKLYLVGLVNALGTTGGAFNRVNCIKLLDINKSDTLDIKFSDFKTINDISKQLKIINKEIVEDSCIKFENEHVDLYNNLNRKHSNIFEHQEVYEKNFRAIKNYLSGRNSFSKLKLISPSFEEELLQISDDILDELSSSISTYIRDKRHGQENLQRIEDKTVEIIKEEINLIKKDRYISNKLQEYLVVGWLLNCNVDFILKDENGA
jgi:hypothetical protein